MRRFSLAWVCLGVLACDNASSPGEDPGATADVPIADTAQDPGGSHQDSPGAIDTGSGGDPGGTTDPGSSGVTYEPPDPATTFTYLLNLCDGNPPVEVPANIAHTEQIGGETWRRLEVGDFQAQTRNGFVSYTRIRNGRYEVIGSDVYQENDEAPILSWRFDAPLGGPISGQDGLTETTSTTGTFCMKDQCQVYEISVTYTLVFSAATITVPYGTVTDTIHIRFEQRSSDMPDFVLESDWWVKSGIGMVKATDVPGFCSLSLKSVNFPSR